MDPTFTDTRKEFLSLIRLVDRDEIHGPLDLALLEFSVACKDATGETPAGAKTTFTDSLDILKLAEAYFVKAILMRDLPVIMAGSDTNAHEIWNDEPLTRDAHKLSKDIEDLRNQAESLLYRVGQGDTQSSGDTKSSVIGSDDEYCDPFGTSGLSGDDTFHTQITWP